MSTPTRAADPARRRDASMSLLVDIAADALDPGYAEAATRRAAAGGRPARRPLSRRGVVTAVLALTGLLLATAAVQARLRAPVATRTRDALVKEVAARTKQTQALSQQLDALRNRTAATRDRMLAVTADGEALADRLARLERVVGTAAVTGPGLQVRLDDAPAASDGSATGGGTSRILDRDLQDVINALWAAGAEAVAVNDERVTAETAIRSAGEAILVDLRPLSPPYVVSAIGDPLGMETAFGASETAARFRTYVQLYGIRFSYRRASGLDLPAASTVELRQAKPAAGSSR
jgi:uncharacterized protein YlxW (UPF0749 family)